MVHMVFDTPRCRHNSVGSRAYDTLKRRGTGSSEQRLDEFFEWVSFGKQLVIYYRYQVCSGPLITSRQSYQLIDLMPLLSVIFEFVYSNAVRLVGPQTIPEQHLRMYRAPLITAKS